MPRSAFAPTLFLAAALAAPAQAGEGHDPRAVVLHIFEVADRDHSGTLTRAEYTDAGLQRFGVSFEACDANGDGETSAAEYLAIYERHHPSRDRLEL